MVAYALRYGEQEIPYGFVRGRMVLHPPSSSRTHQRRAPQASWLAADPRCRLLRPLKSGCPWRWLPKDFPPWKTTVYDCFRRWRIDGTWERLNAELRELLCARLGRDSKPSAGIVDSQSVRTTDVGGNERGFDPAKGVEGSKRHLLVDTEGLVL